MSLHTLEIPYADTSAAMLSWRFGGERLDGLVSKTVVLPAARVTLVVLGSSHQIVVDRGAGEPLIETVACGAGPDAVPSDTRRFVDGATYRFRSTIATMARPDFAATTGSVVANVRRASDGLVAAFPGATTAITALRAKQVGAAISCTTWHAYPQTGEIVRTDTEVTFG